MEQTEMFGRVLTEKGRRVMANALNRARLWDKRTRMEQVLVLLIQKRRRTQEAEQWMTAAEFLHLYCKDYSPHCSDLNEMGVRVRARMTPGKRTTEYRLTDHPTGFYYE